jgi:hypothetical protein
LREFDVVGLSLQYGSPTPTAHHPRPRRIRFAADRTEDDPLVVAGGITATSRAVAPFMDTIVVGDGEKRPDRPSLDDVEKSRSGGRLAGLRLGGIVPLSPRGVARPDTGFLVVDPPSAGTPAPPFPCSAPSS